MIPEKITDWTFEVIKSLTEDVFEETETLEYLQDFEKEEIQRKVAGFANAYGGTIIFGIKEQRSKDKIQKLEKLELVGLENKEGLTNMLASRIASCQPVPRIEHHKVRIPNSDKVLLIAKVHQALDKPVQCENGKFYFRIQSKSELMPREMVKSFFIQTEEKRSRFKRLQFEVSRLIEACKKGNNLNGRHYHPPFELYNLSRLRHLVSENYDALESESFVNVLNRLDAVCADIDVVKSRYEHRIRITEQKPGYIRDQEYQKVCNEENTSLGNKVGELRAVLEDIKKLISV